MQTDPVTLSPDRARLLIVDGHAYAYRSFHAIARLSAPDGSPTNAIYGFIQALTRLRNTFQPAGLNVIWDGGLAEERITALPTYKSHRPPMPEDLRVQIDGINEYLDAAGVPWFCREGIEADDGIASLSRQAEAGGMDVLIASSDKDFMQLASERVGLVIPGDKSQAIWREEQIRNKTGVAPGQIVDWLSLIGDAVDNIPGVPAVGPKTAADLLQRFDSVDGIYARLAEVKSERLQTNLRVAEPDVRRNQRLVRLRDDLSLGFTLENLRPRAADSVRLRELFQRWGFKGLAARLEASQAQQGELL